MFSRLKGNVVNDSVNLVCPLQQLFPFSEVMTPILLFPDAELKVFIVFSPNAVIIPAAALLQCFYLNAGSNCTDSAAAQNKNNILLLNIPLHAVMCFSFFPPDSESWTATAEIVTEEQSEVSRRLAFHCRLDKVLCVTST